MAFTAQIRAQIIMNAYGITFENGKSIEKDMRSLIIDNILSEG